MNPLASKPPPPMMLPQELNSEVMAFSDTFTMRVAQACDEIELKYGKDDAFIRTWAQSTKIGQAFAAMDIATGPNPDINLLDMVAMVTLKRQAIEEHDIPVFLKGKGAEFLRNAYDKSYDEIWRLADRATTDAQLKELRDMIDQWRKENPNQFYVGFVRLEDFSAYRNWQQAPQSAPPGSLFSLLYIDPLAGLDPVARELHAFQDLSARMLFIIQRMPILVQWQVRREIDVALSNSQVTQVVASTATFSQATEKFANAVAAYPNQFRDDTQNLVKSLHAAVTAERTAALDQANQSISGQREAMVKALDDQTSKLGQVVDKIDGAIANLSKAGGAINDSTKQTVVTAEQSTRSLLNHVFLLAVAFLFIVVGLMVGYRLACRRISLKEAGSRVM